MTLYLLYKIKSLTTHKGVVLWGLLFMLFWAVMWVFVFTRVEGEMPGEALRTRLKMYTALAYVYLGVLSITSMTVNISQHLLLASSAVSFATRFTKLSRAKFLLEDFVAGLFSVLLYVFALIVSVIALTYLRFRLLVLPDNVLGLVACLALAGVEAYLIGVFVGLIMLATQRVTPILYFIPLLLGFIIYSSLWLDMGDAVYALPLAPLASMAASCAAGVKAVRGNWLEGWTGQGPPPPELNIGAALASTALMILALALANLALMRKITGKPLEEIVRVAG